MIKLRIATISFLLITLFSANLYSQVDSILTKKSFYKYKYFYQGEKVSANEVINLLVDHPGVQDQFESANQAFIFANVFCVAGLAFVAVPVGMSFADNADWSIALAGTGLILVSVPLFHKYHKKVPLAIETYNSNPLPELQPEIKVRLGVTNNGLGLCVNF